MNADAPSGNLAGGLVEVFDFRLEITVALQRYARRASFQNEQQDRHVMRRGVPPDVGIALDAAEIQPLEKDMIDVAHLAAGGELLRHADRAVVEKRVIDEKHRAFRLRRGNERFSLFV